jgi:two-component system phosphate regulon sensor histidine kinase PhoR
VATIGIQVYWNYINYQANKSELVNQVRISLDDAIESYYADIARKHVVTIFNNDKIIPKPSGEVHKIIKHFNSANSFQVIEDSLVEFEDSLVEFEANFDGTTQSESFSFSYSTNDTTVNYSSDSLQVKMLASKIFVSMNDDIIGAPQLAKLLEIDFANKNWPIKFGLLTRNKNCESRPLLCDSLQVFGSTNQKNQLIASSQSSFLPPDIQLEIHFSNITSILLQKSLFCILLSLILSGAIIYCLLFLFKIIRQQKQLAEIKDDLISNITHEFKTPITTVSAALEGIENFSGLNDVDKTKKYIDISNQQLGKLNVMVEKLLETASLDSKNLSLQLDEVDIVELINQQLEKFRLKSDDKKFIFHHSSEIISSTIDAFHFESVIENLLDNAVKYGGDTITINAVSQADQTLSIEIEDNGKGIAKNQQTKIFEKFYRIPTGNIHDVKGFGIGLYYAKNIVNKHGGQLNLVPSSSKTLFKIMLPHGH